MTSALALLGGTPAFPDRLPLVRPTIPDIPGVAARLQQVLESGMLTNGAMVRELEARAAELLEVPHVVAVSSCTAGLMLTLQHLGARGPVVMPSFTFSASAHAVHWAGGTPVFAEVREQDCTLDPDDAARQVARSGAVAMTATHIYGTPCRVDELQQVADAAGIPLVYDAAHALGSSAAGRKVGGFGAAEVFSMSPTKVTTAVEGGLVATRDADLAAALRVGRDYGNPGDYDCLFPGINARMSELHATVGLACIEGVEDRVRYRTQLVEAFADVVAGVPGVRLVRPVDGDVSTYKDLTMVLSEDYGLTSTELGLVLRSEGVDSRRYYAPPIHRQKAYAHLPVQDLPLTDQLAGTVLTPPLYSHMTVEQAQSVARVVVVAHESAVALRAALAAAAA